MKPVKPPATTAAIAVTPESTVAVASSIAHNRRSQPPRQTRMNPPRSQRGSGLGAGGGRDGDSGPSDQPINIFPAINYLADSLTTLPKELIRHFTLLKEVDAKIYAPEETLFNLTDACYTAPMPQSKPLPEGVPERLQGVVAGGEALHNLDPTPVPNTLGGAPGEPNFRASLYDPQNLDRRQLFASTAAQIKEMLVALEEKNHVISTANDALQKQLARMDNVWPHLEEDFCDEAKWGSVNHWAYPENRAKEGRRRDHISAAALAAAEEAAARSDARKQAVQAKKEKKQQQQQQQQQENDSEENKKAKSRRAPEASTSTGPAHTSVGLGISSGSTNNGASTIKRRKAEKAPTANGTGSADKTSSAASSNGTKQTKPPASPAPHVPDGTRKRKAASTTTAQPKKSRNGAGTTTSAVSSPVLGALPDPKTTSARNSPKPTSNSRPPASRGRQNSITSASTENGKGSKPTGPSHKSSGAGPLTPELGAALTGPVLTRPEIKKETETHEPGTLTLGGSPRKRDTALSRTDDRGRSNTTTPVLPPSMPTATTKSGRVSKPSTPALATFQETSARLRTSRSSDSGKETKRKKGSTPLQAQTVVEEEVTAVANVEAMDATVQEDEEMEDANEPTYCFCNGVSYGAMVACDADDCAREWFHLECVGLKVAPKTNAKWYCNDCKEKMKPGSKKTSR
ncbi:hypothetical protein BROUX41_005155 [Berkeleyomyces rouxiae]|uniref:uncharacterized protein n=1 Tax=Berkeleyomyces rouxiae TaxID=2035830 RepID=UPI003B780C90